MLWQWSPGVMAELAASAILLVWAIYFPWRDVNRQARVISVTLVFTCALWILSHAIEIGVPSVPYKEAMVGLQLVCGTIAMTFWLLYILHYLGPKNLITRRIYVLFGIMPVIAILALLTNNIYGLMWTASGIDSQNPYLPLQPTYGVIYWACMVYIAILTLTGSFLITWNIVRSRHSYRRKSIFLLTAAVLPLVTAFIEVTGLLSDLKLSVGLSSWTACIGTIIIILNLPKLHSEQIIPIARDIVFERIGDCILVLDMHNRVLDLNPAAEQLIGCRISDAVGLTIDKLWPYQSTPLTQAKEGMDLVLEKDGKQRAYALHISTINESGRGIISKVVLLTDITERKKAEESQQREHIMLERTEGIALIGSWEWDIAKDKVTWSDELFRIFQRDPKEGAPSFTQHPAFYHPDDMERLKHAVAAAVADGTPYELELRAIRKDGETRVCMARGVAEMGLNGRVIRLFGSLQDITEVKQKDEALRGSENLYRSLFDNMLNGFAYCKMLFDQDQPRDFIYLVVNEAFEKQTGLKDVTGKKVSEVIPGIYETDPQLLKSYGRVALTGIPEKLEIYVAALKMWFSVSVYSPQKEYFVSVFDVITERKQNEAKLAKSYESLKKTLNDAIDTIAKIVETRDPYTAGHQQRVADLANAIAHEMKLEDSRIDQIRMAAVIHDIGKMYVPSEILSKPGKLSAMEFNLIKTHAQAGYDIVKGIDLPCSVAKAILQHHERPDGSGYPNQLMDDDIIMEAKILAVADVIEAMASHRPYRPALGIDKALDEILQNRGILYDPDVVDACVQVFNRGRFEFKSI